MAKLFVIDGLCSLCVVNILLLGAFENDLVAFLVSQLVLHDERARQRVQRRVRVGGPRRIEQLTGEVPAFTTSTGRLKTVSEGTALLQPALELFLHRLFTFGTSGVMGGCVVVLRRVSTVALSIFYHRQARSPLDQVLACLRLLRGTFLHDERGCIGAVLLNEPEHLLVLIG